MKKIIISVFALILVIIFASQSFAIVPVGYTGILLHMGKVQDSALSEGVHFKIPFVQRIVAIDNRVKKLEMNTEAFSKDIQTVSAMLAVN